MNELEAARATWNNAFATFVDENAKATKHTLKAQAARKAYTLARDEVRALERDLMSYGPIYIS